jgi:hypothetical protein
MNSITRLTILFSLFAIAIPVMAAEPLTIDNFVRADTDTFFKKVVDNGCFGQLCKIPGSAIGNTGPKSNITHSEPYSYGVFDLTWPITITLPDSDKSDQSVVFINEDHKIDHFPKIDEPIMVRQEDVGTRYVLVLVRGFTGSTARKDMQADKSTHTGPHTGPQSGPQQGIKVSQKNIGEFDIPDWNTQELDALRTALKALTPFVPHYHDKGIDESDPVKRLVGIANGWGYQAEDAFYEYNTVPKNDGKTAYTLIVDQVPPVDGFWSVSINNGESFYQASDDTRSINSVSAKKNDDGSISIHFGGDPKAINYLPIQPGWHYVVRIYHPRSEIFSGNWHFPKPIQNNEWQDN